MTEMTTDGPCGSHFGPAVYSYSREQAIEDGVLVDLSQSAEWKEAGFKFPGAMTRAAWEQTIEAGGKWEEQEGETVLVLPRGQDMNGRLWDVMTMLKHGIHSAPGSTDRVHFQVKVSGKLVRLWSLIGPGDTAEPVITIMLEGED